MVTKTFRDAEAVLPNKDVLLKLFKPDPSTFSEKAKRLHAVSAAWISGTTKI